MKSTLQKLILVTSLSMAPFALLAEQPAFSKNKINVDISETASTIGLSSGDYLAAVRKWERLVSGVGGKNLKSLDEYEAIQESYYYMENDLELPKELSRKVLRIMNIQKSQLATYLGIDVYQLKDFLGNHEDVNTSKADESISQEEPVMGLLKDNIERIIIKCRDFCSSGKDWQGHTLAVKTQSLARAKGIPQYVTFVVDFEDYDSGIIYDAEYWRHKNSVGGYPVLTGEKPVCSGCDPF